MHKAYLLMMALVSILYGCATTEADLQKRGLKPMTADELRAVFADITFVGTSSRGGSYITYLSKDGKLSGASGGQHDAGMWEAVEGDKNCFQFKTWMGGKRQCTHIYKAGDDYFEYDLNGNYMGTFKLVSGNPNNL